MTRYKLPEALGGGELSGVLMDKGQTVAFRLEAEGSYFELPAKLLTEVEPPLPPEPPVGSVVLDADGHAWQAVESHSRGTAWLCAHEVSDEDWAGLNTAYGPLIHLWRPWPKQPEAVTP